MQIEFGDYFIPVMSEGVVPSQIWMKGMKPYAIVILWEELGKEIKKGESIEKTKQQIIDTMKNQGKND
jgi:hypothetical protein